MLRKLQATRPRGISAMESSTSSSEDFGRLVWISDAHDGFVLARINDITQDGLRLTVEKSGDTVTRKYDETFACESDVSKSVDDNCALMHLNEATLLNNCRLRYADRKIYSYVANILISINPYERIEGLYSPEKIQQYRGKSLGQLEPHIYAIADKSYRDLRRTRTSQSIIVSGESGAGKTESQKAILRYLCENWGQNAGPIQQRLLEANPILEAFGNAKTLRNNNSSRFGKFVQIHFSENGHVAGGFISHYLLETSRVCCQSAGERNYHIFYQLIAGASEDLYKYLGLSPAAKFTYLKNGATEFFGDSRGSIASNRCSTPNMVHDSMVDDYSDFARLEKALTLAGIDADRQVFIWSTIAAILHLGNIAFEENLGDSRGGSRVKECSEGSVAHAARLLGLEAEEMKMGLCARIMQATKGGVKGTLIRVPLKPSEASAGRDALAKAIYAKLFDWLVALVNKSIPCDTSIGYIGVLDVAGFEFFAVNSFEQFCINYCNEKLQHFFNERVLRQEQELYASEHLAVRHVPFTDNRDCIELFETRATGLFDLLDEEAKLPRATFQHFTQRAHDANRGNFRLDTPRKSKVKSHREMRDEEGLLVRHFAGSVCYETCQFLEKNNDQLHNSLEILIEQSSVTNLVELFGDTMGKTGGKLKMRSVGGKFKTQLTTLLDVLHTTGTHFVRCVKPNNAMRAWDFDGAAILAQMQCAGMASVMRVMQRGFPSRTSFAELYAMYESSLPAELARLDPPLFCKCLLRAIGLARDEYAFGVTRVFFKAGTFAQFDRMMRQDEVAMRELVSRVAAWLVKARWRKVQYGVWSVVKLRNKILYRAEKICKIQSLTRGYLQRKRFQKRITIFRKACDLLLSSREMTEILSRMNEASQEKWREIAEATNGELEDLVRIIKESNVASEIDRAAERYEECVKRVDSIVCDLKHQLESDELAEMARKRAEAEEIERRERAEREAAEREKEERRRINLAREKAEQEHLANLEKEKAIVEAQRVAEQSRRDKEERDRLDALVSTRLATADGVALVQNEQQGAPLKSATNSKYNLSEWKYADLRDVINTSSDVGLLMACKEEFHHRLRIYNEWKAKNVANRDVPPPQRAPLSVYNEESSSSMALVPSRVTMQAPALNPALVQQRYFKVAFNTRGKRGEKELGVWYAHFNGQYIQRQLTVRPLAKPQLLVAGKDDLQMCELPLEQTGLLRKKGAEIRAGDFEIMWQHYGGEPVKQWAP